MYTAVYFSDSVAVRRGHIDWTKSYKSNLVLSAFRDDLNSWNITEYKDSAEIIKSGKKIKENVTDFEFVHFLAALDPEELEVTFYSDKENQLKQIAKYDSRELIRFRDRLEVVR